MLDSFVEDEQRTIETLVQQLAAYLVNDVSDFKVLLSLKVLVLFCTASQ